MFLNKESKQETESYLKESDHYKQELKELSKELTNRYISIVGEIGRGIVGIWLMLFPISIVFPIVAILTNSIPIEVAYTSGAILTLGLILSAITLIRSTRSNKLSLKKILEGLIEAQVELEALEDMEAKEGAYILHEKLQLVSNTKKK